MSQNEYFLLICYVFGNFATDREILLTLRGFSAFTMIMQESQNERENAHTKKILKIRHCEFEKKLYKTITLANFSPLEAEDEL